LAFHKRSCAIISASALAAAKRRAVHTTSSRKKGPSTPHNDQGPLKPVWSRKQRILRIGSHIAKRLHKPAASQEPVLDAFQTRGWPRSIPDPLPRVPDLDPQRHLNDTLKNLNRGQ